MTVGVPFTRLVPDEDREAVEAAIARVVDSGWFVLGPEVEAFEAEFAAACGTSASVGVGTGTDAIALILRALGIGPGDEVVTTPVSAAYTALAVMMTGARPVFADIDPQRLTLDPRAAESAVTPRTRALLPVHLYGQPADMPALAAVAERHGLALVEDCCQAHLATCEGQPVGSWSAAAAFSFYPTKNLGALGDGGAIVTSDRMLAERLKRLRNGGQSDRYHHAEFGVNSRLDEIQAAVLRARLPYLRGWTAARRAAASKLRATIRTPHVTVPPEADPGHVYHLFAVLTTRREELRGHLAAAGIETLIHYPVPVPRQPALSAMRPAVCPVADRICNQVLSLPLHPAITPSELDAIQAAVNSFSQP
ncbi:MAG: DegT/DnrJ/EryC1/StrS family aminotransferase [Vicinamibacterales bacterium]